MALFEGRVTELSFEISAKTTAAENSPGNLDVIGGITSEQRCGSEAVSSEGAARISGIDGDF
jgi:hypothetical protein